jgi:hypothetical protein
LLRPPDKQNWRAHRWAPQLLSSLIGAFPLTANPPVPGAISDPVLELHDGNGVIVASNDNWKDTQEAEIIATTIPLTNNFESAIVATLAPGAYTAIVSGKNNVTGVALVEAYNLE